MQIEIKVKDGYSYEVRVTAVYKDKPKGKSELVFHAELVEGMVSFFDYSKTHEGKTMEEAVRNIAEELESALEQMMGF